MKDSAKATLEAVGHRVTIADLHAMNFKAGADADDFGSRGDPDYLTYALEQRHAYEAGTLAPDIMAEVANVLAADLVILNAPMYWFSIPALMKGWMDRVFLSGPFYGGKRIYDRAGLTGKKALLSMTLGCQPHMLTEDSVHGDIMTMLRPVLRSLGYVGMEVLEPYFAYHVPYVDDAARADIMTDYCTFIGNIESVPALAMPSLDDFDDRFYPK